LKKACGAIKVHCFICAHFAEVCTHTHTYTHIHTQRTHTLYVLAVLAGQGHARCHAGVAGSCDGGQHGACKDAGVFVFVRVCVCLGVTCKDAGVCLYVYVCVSVGV
jgi:hypothetical protein